MPTHKPTASRSMPNDRRQLAPPSPPVFFPYPMLPYNHPYASAHAPPMGYMPSQPWFVPLPPTTTPPPSFVPPPPPPPPPTIPPPSFVPPPPPPPPLPPTIPPWSWNNTCIYTQTLMHPPYNYSFPHPTPTPTPTPIPIPYSINYTTPPLHPPSNSFPTPSAPPLPLHSFPPSKEDLSHKILKQIEYYFCDNNLAKDLHLKDHMDIDNGWVPIEVIAGFTRIKNMTHDIKLILDSLKDSDTVEVEGDKVRRRTTWKKWIAYRKAAPHGVRISTQLRVSSKEKAKANK